MGARIVPWAVFPLFVGSALWLDGQARLFAFDGRLGTTKLLVWLTWLAFLAYTVYCSSREDLVNLVTYLYVAVHFEEIVAKFLA